MTIEGSLSVGVAAHRDLLASEISGLEKCLRAFFRELRQEYPGLQIQLISQLAEGGDQLAARIALEQGCRLHTLLPMAQEDYERDLSTPQALDEFLRLLGLSENVIELDAGANGVDEHRDHLYARAGQFTSNHCQILLAIWDGKKTPQLGGTGSVMHYHLTGVMEGFDDYEAAASLLADDENDLAFHIVCSRDRPEGAPQNGLTPLQSGWQTVPYNVVLHTRMPTNFRVMLQRLQEFHADSDRFQASINKESRSLLGSDVKLPANLPLPGGVGMIDRLFRHADWLAIHFQKKVNRGLLATYSLAALMGLVFILYSEGVGPESLVLVFVALFFAGYVLQKVGDRKNWHRKYLDYRALAEGLRVQLYWSLAGVVETHSAEFAYSNFLQKQDVELGWIRHVMRSASMARDRRSEPHAGWVEWVMVYWVGGSGTGQGQLSYYTRKRKLNAYNYRKTGRLSNASLWLGIVIAVALAFVSSDIGGTSRRILLILMGMLPLIAGVRDAYSHKKAEKELIKQYQFIARVFENAQRLLQNTTDLQFRRRVLRALGQAALEEGAEWILMHRERPLEHGRL